MYASQKLTSSPTTIACGASSIQTSSIHYNKFNHDVKVRLKNNLT